MTKEQRENMCMTVLDSLKKGGYLKGQGKQKRVMSQDHSPIITISNDIFNLLEINGLLKKDGLIYRWSRNPFPNKFLFEKR